MRARLECQQWPLVASNRQKTPSFSLPDDRCDEPTQKHTINLFLRNHAHTPTLRSIAAKHKQKKTKQNRTKQNDVRTGKDAIEQTTLQIINGRTSARNMRIKISPAFCAQEPPKKRPMSSARIASRSRARQTRPGKPTTLMTVFDAPDVARIMPKRMPLAAPICVIITQSKRSRVPVHAAARAIVQVCRATTASERSDARSLRRCCRRRRRALLVTDRRPNTTCTLLSPSTAPCLTTGIVY